MLEPLLSQLNSMRVILASSSKQRATLLESTKLKFEIIASNYEENLNPTDHTYSDFVEKTALGKLHDVYERSKNDSRKPDLIISSDTMVTYNGKMYGKPKTKVEAIKCITAKLWDTKPPNYPNKGLREEAWIHISKVMGLPIDELKNKMESLLGAYRREKSREKQSRTRNPDSDDVYTSKWYAYECFKFLENRNNLVETEEMLEDVKVEVLLDHSETDGEKDDQTLEAESTETLEIEQPIQSSCPNLKRKSTNIQEDESPRVAFTFWNECTESPDDPYNTYGRHIANELRKYDPLTLAHVKNAINNIIFEADTGSFRQCVQNRMQDVMPNINPINQDP